MQKTIELLKKRVNLLSRLLSKSKLVSRRIQHQRMLDIFAFTAGYEDWRDLLCSHGYSSRSNPIDSDADVDTEHIAFDYRRLQEVLEIDEENAKFIIKQICFSSYAQETLYCKENIIDFLNYPKSRNSWFDSSYLNLYIKKSYIEFHARDNHIYSGKCIMVGAVEVKYTSRVYLEFKELLDTLKNNTLLPIVFNEIFIYKLVVAKPLSNNTKTKYNIRLKNIEEACHHILYFLDSNPNLEKGYDKYVSDQHIVYISNKCLLQKSSP